MRKTNPEIDARARRWIGAPAAVERLEKLLRSGEQRLAKLRTLNAPQQILDNEEDLLAIRRRALELVRPRL